MSVTTKTIGFVIKQRGEYVSNPETRYYKDNVVQYHDSSYIANPIDYDAEENPLAYVTSAPVNNEGVLNEGWKIFASGNNTFSTGEKVTEIGIDDKPTVGSNSLVKSGGVQNELTLGAVYDVSAKNPTAGPNNDGKWESLSALLSDASLNILIPTAVRKGGMSVKFVQSSDNKYVQYRLMSKNFSTTKSDWQGVDDEPTAGSDNLVKSGGVNLKLLELGEKCLAEPETFETEASVGKWDGSHIGTTPDNRAHLKINCSGYEKIKVVIPEGWYGNFYYIDENDNNQGALITDWASGTIELLINSIYDIIINIKYGSAGTTTIDAALLNGVNWGITLYKEYAPAAPNSEFVIQKKNNKALLDYIGVENIIDISSFIQYDGIPRNKWVAAGKHIIIPVTNGEKYAIIGGSIIKYGLLTNSHSEPVNYGNNVNYINGETDILTFNGEEIINIPSDAAFLCIETLGYYGEVADIKEVLKLNSDITTTIENEERISELGIQTSSLNKSVFGIENELIIPSFEKGYIGAGGNKGDSVTVVRTSQSIPVQQINGSLVKVKALLSEAQAICQDVAAINLNVHCWNSSMVSLGRTATGYAIVSNGDYVDYPLLDGTAFIDITLSFLDSNGTGINSNDFISGLNSSISDIFDILDKKYSVEQEIKAVSENVDELSNKIQHTEYTHPYYGDVIRLNENKCKHYRYMSIAFPGSSGQGCISFNDYLLVGGAGGYIRVYNLITKSVIDTITLASAGADNHVNNLSFGVEGNPLNTDFNKYLYISELNISDVTQNRCFVEDFSFSGSILVQTIIYNGSHFRGNFEWIVDTDRKFIFAIGNTELSALTQGNKIAILKFNLPKISDGTTITLTDDDIISYHIYEETTDTPDDAFMYILQGGEYYNGMILLSFGGAASVSARPIYFIDCDTFEIKSIIQTRDIYDHEIEGVTVYNDKLLVCYPNSGSVYALEFV